MRVTDVNERVGGRTANTKGGEKRLSVFGLLRSGGVLSEPELASLSGADNAKDEAFEPNTKPQEKGSTWQLHSDPFV